MMLPLPWGTAEGRGFGAETTVCWSQGSRLSVPGAGPLPRHPQGPGVGVGVPGPPVFLGRGTVNFSPRWRSPAQAVGCLGLV